VESFAQFRDVSFVETAFLVQDFGYDAFRAKDWDQVLLAEIMGIHQRTKDFHRGSIWDGVMVFFVCFNQGQEDRSILLLISRWVRFAGQLVQDRQVLLVLARRCNRCWQA